MAEMIWPTVCKTISQGYGVKNSRYVSGYHTGLDIACINGSPIKAAHDGTVSFAGSAGVYGNQVKIKRGDLETWYNHLSAIRVSQGQNVSQGTIIGLEGSTGQSTGPHLHFEVRVGGKHVDPMPYLQGSSVLPASTGTQTGVGDVFTLPAKMLVAMKWLTDPVNWLRAAMLIGGFVLLVMALVGLAKTQSLGKKGIGVMKNAVSRSTGSK